MRNKTKNGVGLLFLVLVFFSSAVYSMEPDLEIDVDGFRELSKTASLACPDVSRTLPYGHLSGLTLVRSGEGFTLEAQPGQAISLDTTTGYPNGCFMELKQKLNKLIKCSGWQKGSGACGLTTPHTFKSNETYHVFLMMDQSGAVDIGFDMMVDGVYLRVNTSYPFVRRIGSIYTTSDPANPTIVDFTQYAEKFYLKTPYTVYSGSLNGTQTVQLPTPKNITAEVMLLGALSATNHVNGYIRAVGYKSGAVDLVVNTYSQWSTVTKTIPQTPDAKIEISTTTAPLLFNVELEGWIDYRDQY